VDRKSQKALISLRFCAVLTYGRRRTSVNFGFIFANLCKLSYKRGLSRICGQTSFGSCVFAESLFFDYSDAIID